MFSRERGWSVAFLPKPSNKMTANRPDPPDSNSKEMNFPMELEQLEDSDLSAAGNGAENAVAQGNQNGLVPLHSTPIKPNLDSKNTEISDLLIVDTNIVIKEGPKSAQDSGKDIVGEASKADPVPEHQVPTITSTEIETAVEIKDTNEIISREDSADKDDQQGTAATATTASTLSLTPSPEKDPDGSLRSWLILFAGFSGSMWSAGLSVSWGVFQRTLLTEDTFPGATNFQLSFVGTVIFGVSVIAIFFVGPMTDLFPPASLALAGAVCCATSMLSMSFATALWQMYLASALYGIGGSLVYTPGTVMVNTWFTRRRPFAMGILAAGTGVASFIMNPIAQACISARDWRFALRILALMCICWMGPTALLLKRRLKPVKRKGSFITFVYFKNITFSLLFASVLSIMFVFFFPPIYIPLLLFDGGYSNATGAAAVSVFSAVMAIGRVIGGAMAMKAGEVSLQRI